MALSNAPRLSLCDPDHPLVSDWTCPVCDVKIEHDGAPGRRRIYCTNACRQRAYRWRRRNQVFTIHTTRHPAEGALGRTGMRHALRTLRDPAAGPNYGARHEELTVCGVLARPGRINPGVRHYRFTATTWSCASCRSLTMAEPAPPFQWPMPPVPWHAPRPWFDDTESAGAPPVGSGSGATTRAA